MRPLIAVFALALGAEAALGLVLDSLVARVDDRVITRSQVLQEMQLRRVEGAPESALDFAAVLQSLIRQRLFVKEAEKLRLEVDSGDSSKAVDALAATRGDVFWKRIAAMGLSRTDLVQRTRQGRLAQAYLDLRREMTFVPIAEIRAFHARHAEDFGDQPLAEVRDEVQVRVAQAKYDRELTEWVDRQVAEGRVQRVPIPEPR